jgi:hypothetical protein
MLDPAIEAVRGMPAGGHTLEVVRDALRKPYIDDRRNAARDIALQYVHATRWCGALSQDE